MVRQASTCSFRPSVPFSPNSAHCLTPMKTKMSCSFGVLVLLVSWCTAHAGDIRTDGSSSSPGRFGIDWAAQVLPGQLIPALPGQGVQPLSGQIVPPLPGQLVPLLPGQLTAALPGQVVPLAPRPVVPPALRADRALPVRPDGGRAARPTHPLTPRSSFAPTLQPGRAHPRPGRTSRSDAFPHDALRGISPFSIFPSARRLTLPSPSPPDTHRH